VAANPPKSIITKNRRFIFILLFSRGFTGLK